MAERICGMLEGVNETHANTTRPKQQMPGTSRHQSSRQKEESPQGLHHQKVSSY